MKKNRDFSLDVIRVVAVFLVITVHFFLHSGYYKIPFVGNSKIFMEAIRIFAMTCVPLFLILTGYLKNGKKIEKKYYKAIIPIYSMYVFCSIAELLFKKYYIGQDMSFLHMIKSILNFTGANYSWYVEMYIGLFLLVPFLNVMWNNLKNKKEHQALIITLIVCVVLPSILNNFNFTTNLSDFFVAQKGKDQLIPDWWVNLYPIMYYFIGAYIYKYEKDLKINSKKIFTALIMCCFVFACLNYLRNDGIIFRKESFDYNWYGFEIVINSVLLFIGIKYMKFDSVPTFVKKLVTKLSIISFGTYLISHIFDTIFYNNLINNVTVVTNRFIYLPLIVVMVFVGSNIVSFILYYIYGVLVKIFLYIKATIKKIKHCKYMANYL